MATLFIRIPYQIRDAGNANQRHVRVPRPLTGNWPHTKIGGYESPLAAEIATWRLREDFAAEAVTERWVWERPLALDASKRRT